MKPETPAVWSSSFESLARIVMRLRLVFILVIALLTVFFASRLTELKLDSSNENAMRQDAPSIMLGKQFRSIFGNDDFVYLLFEIEESSSALEKVHSIRRLAAELERSVPYLQRLTWLGNAEYAVGSDNSLEIREFLDPLPETGPELQRALEQALDEPLYVDTLLSADKRVLGLLLEMAPYPAEKTDPRKEVAPAVRRVLSSPAFKALNARAVGIPILDYDMDVTTAREGLLFLGLVLVVQAILLRWMGGGLKAVAVPLLIMVLSNIWTFGVITWLGYSLNLLSIMVPVLLVCVSIGYSMHAIAEYRRRILAGVPKRRAVAEALGKVGLPCTITALTTALGFLSFTVTDSKMISEMGVYTAIGVFIAFGLTLLLVPLLYSFGKSPQPPAAASAGQPGDHFDRLLFGVYKIVSRRPRLVVAVFMVLTGAAFCGYFRVQVETDFIHMFTQRTELRRSVDFVDRRMGGSLSLEIMLDTGQADGVKDPLFLARMERLQRYIDERPISSHTISVVDTLKSVNKALHNGRQDHYILPAERELVSQYLFLYETSGGEELDRLVNLDYSIARLTVKTPSIGTSELRLFMEQLDEYASQLFPAAQVKVDLIGIMREHQDLADVLATGQKKSFLTAFLAITLIMILVLRSLPLGLISMIPNIVPVLFSLGLMGWLGIGMDLALMTFSAVVIGVSVDDTIHFFTRYRAAYDACRDYREALQHTLLSVGRPIVFTTITLVLGLAMFTPSVMLSIVRFGLLAGFAFFWALLADFFLAPALILLLKPLGSENTPRAILLPGQIDPSISPKEVIQ
jgi:uncharacterized protein